MSFECILEEGEIVVKRIVRVILVRAWKGYRRDIEQISSSLDLNINNHIRKWIINVILMWSQMKMRNV